MKPFYLFKTEISHGLVKFTVKRLLADCCRISSIGGIVLFCLICVTGCNSDFEILLHEHDGIYWAESSGTINSIKRDCSDKKTLVTLAGTPLDIEIYDDKIYWAEYTGSEYQIRRSGLYDSGTVTLYSVSASGSDGPLSIAIDRREGTIFWNQNIGGVNDIWKSEISPDTLSPVKWINTISNSYTYSICIDQINRKIYFTANSYYDHVITLGSGNSGAIYLGELDAINSYSLKISNTGLTSPSAPYQDIAVDHEGGHVYYITYTAPYFRIGRRDLSADNFEIWIPVGSFDFQQIALDIKHRKIYWTSETDNSIYRADLDVQYPDVEKFLQLCSTPTAITIYQ
jgi:hypothetical protein